jgi:hypothetical protein
MRSDARDRLAALRQRRRPANDLMGDFFSVTTPEDIRSELDQLKASYDIVHQTAAGRPEWDTHYQEFAAYYQRTRPRIGWLSSGQGTIDQLRDRRRQLEQWKQRLSEEGVRVKDPKRAEPPPGAADSFGSLLKWGAVVLGLSLAVRR